MFRTHLKNTSVRDIGQFRAMQGGTTKACPVALRGGATRQHVKWAYSHKDCGDFPVPLRYASVAVPQSTASSASLADTGKVAQNAGLGGILEMGSKSGYITLISTLIAGAIGVATAVSLLLLGLGLSRTSFAIEQSAQARGLANACAEEALEQIKTSSNFSGSNNLSLGPGTCSYTVQKGSGQNRIITASGMVGTIVRKVKITLDKVKPTLRVTSWQEVADF